MQEVRSADLRKPARLSRASVLLYFAPHEADDDYADSNDGNASVALLLIVHSQS